MRGFAASINKIESKNHLILAVRVQLYEYEGALMTTAQSLLFSSRTAASTLATRAMPSSSVAMSRT